MDTLEKYLPIYLQKDIAALLKGEEENSSVLDCLYNEVQGSVNLALYSGAITDSEAKYLREKYLGLT
ncbi:MAG: hypothetical protein LBH24_00875 [Clostridiales bacterium]|nr:hypothetical protein [Clostridiales bacterium]